MNYKRRIYYWLSPELRMIARRIYYFPQDVHDYFFDSQIKRPPKGKIYTGLKDFEEIGNKFKNLCISHGGLLPHHHVLDVGSGIGRIALPLTEYLTKDAKYEGIDIVKTGVDWCTKNITSSFPNFTFTHVDLKNDLYNLETETNARDFVFPYRDESFDFVVLTSVFTHMLPEDVENYIAQITRVLKPGGRCLMTFFMLNAERRKKLPNGQVIHFDYDYGHFSLMDTHVKEANVAYDEDYIKQLFEYKNLKVELLNYGHWATGDVSSSIDFQDIIIVRRV